MGPEADVQSFEWDTHDDLMVLGCMRGAQAKIEVFA